MSARDIILLDLDSVLVRPLGYRAALRATVDHFRARLGLPPDPPTEDEIEIFESCGFGSEWHAVPACVAQILVEAGAALPGIWRETLDQTVDAVAHAALHLPRTAYGALIQRIDAEAGADGKLAPLRALDYFIARTPPEAWPVLHELLGRTFDITAPATRVFQHYTLGSARFPHTYGFGPDFNTESLLMALDESLLSAQGRALLLESGAPIAVYTARPSLPPPTAADRTGYAPEAEMACELLGLDGIPLVGFGHVSWLAQQHGVQPDVYTKPSPVQALAAIGAAVEGAPDGVAPALQAARALAAHGALEGPLAALGVCNGDVRVTVFEDTPGGAMAVRRAGEALRAAALPVRVRVVGVGATDIKRRALEPVADLLVADVNEGLRLALRP